MRAKLVLVLVLAMLSMKCVNAQKVIIEDGFNFLNPDSVNLDWKFYNVKLDTLFDNSGIYTKPYYKSYYKNIEFYSHQNKGRSLFMFSTLGKADSNGVFDDWMIFRQKKLFVPTDSVSLWAGIEGYLASKNNQPRPDTLEVYLLSEPNPKASAVRLIKSFALSDSTPIWRNLKAPLSDGINVNVEGYFAIRHHLKKSGVNGVSGSALWFDDIFVGNRAQTMAVNSQKYVNARVSIHPNPANDVLRISLKGVPDIKILAEVYNVTGQKLIQTSLENNATINIQNLDNGIYTISLKDEAGNAIKQEKFVVQH